MLADDPAYFKNDASFYGNVHITGGGISYPYSAKTGTYTLTESDSVVNVTSGTFTITLPSAVSIPGRVYTLKNSGSGTITVDGSTTETIDGSLTVKLLSRFSAITIQSDGANWVILSCISPIQMSVP